MLAVLSFPRFDLYGLAWIALVPLHLAIQGRSPWAAFGAGWVAGAVFFIGTMSWVTHTMIVFGKLPAIVSYPLMFLLVAYLGLYFGLFAVVAAFLHRRLGPYSALLAPALWTSLELLRTYALSGLPWAALGYSQYLALPVIQVADLAGVYGVSFWIVLVNLAIAETISAIRSRRVGAAGWIVVGSAAAFSAFALAYGEWRLTADRVSDPPTIRAGVVQANIPQDVKWDVRFRQETVRTYRRLSDELARQSLGLMVWPEAAMPFFFEEDLAFRHQVAQTAREAGVPLLFGSPAVTIVSGRTRLHNSAYLLSPGGEILGRYDKIHLVPFGEYVPLSGLLFFVNKMVEGIGDFLPGSDYTVFPLPDARLGVVICYEVIFPDLVRRFVKEGADLMATITNDAWFGDSAAPFQHFSMVVFRAVENRVPFVRAANTGVSGFIDRTGRIQGMSPLFVEAAMADTVRLGDERTFYTQYGDIFSYACVIITLAAILLATRMHSKRSP